MEREDVLRLTANSPARRIAIASLDEERFLLRTGRYIPTFEPSRESASEDLAVTAERRIFKPFPFTHRVREYWDHDRWGRLMAFPLYGAAFVMAAAFDVAMFPVGTWWWAGEKRTTSLSAGPSDACNVPEELARLRSDFEDVPLGEFLYSASPRAGRTHADHFRGVHQFSP